MKFLPVLRPDTIVCRYSGFAQVEDYIDKKIAENMTQIVQTGSTTNLSTAQQSALHTLQKARQSITIKPADKNLGIVILNTDDYITACLAYFNR